MEQKTLLDEFAMAALTGLLTQDFKNPRDCIIWAYNFADAMMKEREKHNKE